MPLPSHNTLLNVLAKMFLNAEEDKLFGVEEIRNYVFKELGLSQELINIKYEAVDTRKASFRIGRSRQSMINLGLVECSFARSKTGKVYRRYRITRLGKIILQHEKTLSSQVIGKYVSLRKIAEKKKVPFEDYLINEYYKYYNKANK